MNDGAQQTGLFRSRRERRLWTLAALTLLAIYTTLYSVRAVSNFLRDRGLLGTSVLIAFALAAVVILVAVVRSRPGWRQLAVLGVFAAIYAVGLSVLELPEERLHFLEYGLVGGLIYAALRERARASGREDRRSGLQAAVLATLITAAAGWLDEGIQAVLPNRYYDLRDVAFNAAAGLLAVIGMVLLEAARERDGMRPSRAP